MNFIITIISSLLSITGILIENKTNKDPNAVRYWKIPKLYNKFLNKKLVTKSDILPYAKNVLTREMTYQLLEQYEKTELFPKEYFTIVKATESNLAYWLYFTSDLDACPDEIEHIKSVTISNSQDNFQYEVFRYKVLSPHPESVKGWMLGVVGPYFKDSKPYKFSFCTYSRMNNTATSDEEAKWVHENIYLKNLVIDTVT